MLRGGKPGRRSARACLRHDLPRAPVHALEQRRRGAAQTDQHIAAIEREPVAQKLADLTAANPNSEELRRQYLQNADAMRQIESAALEDQTATGKLNAEMTAVMPAGCQVSIMRWPGRSDAMVRP